MSNYTLINKNTTIRMEKGSELNAMAAQEMSAEFNSAWELIKAERQRQDAKWGIQNHDPIVWMSILGEEYGELCQAANETHFDNGPEERTKGGFENMMAEASQVAAVAIALMECLTRNQRDERGFYVNGWIPCEKELPRIGEHVWIMTESGLTLGAHRDVLGWTVLYTGDPITEMPTHWQPVAKTT